MVDALGTPIDGAGPIATKTRRRVELKARERAPASVNQICDMRHLHACSPSLSISQVGKEQIGKRISTESTAQAPGIIPRQSVHEPMTGMRNSFFGTPTFIYSSTHFAFLSTKKEGRY